MANDFVNGNMPNTILCKHTLSLIQMPILSCEGTFLLPTHCSIVFGNIVTKLISWRNFGEISHFTVSRSPVILAESEVYRCGLREWISRPVSYFCTCRTEYLPRG